MLICGNGGNGAADCEHIVGELMKGYLAKRPLPDGDRRRLTDAFGQAGHELADRLQRALPTISLPSQVSLITAYANDVAPEMIFAQQVYGYGKEGDVLIGISTSGNSANVVHAAEVARLWPVRHRFHRCRRRQARRGLRCDDWRALSAYGRNQERHLPIYHVLCEMLEEAFFV